MNLDPGMMNMMKDLDEEEMNKQLGSLGLSPSEVINKIMADPELAAAFQKPKVMQVSGFRCKEFLVNGCLRSPGMVESCHPIVVWPPPPACDHGARQLAEY